MHRCLINTACVLCSAAALAGTGCGAGGRGDGPVTVATTENGERITWSELDALTKAFADRQVGLIYGVAKDLSDGADPAGRRAAASLLADCATNLYNIASGEDVFNRVLDFAVVSELMRRHWNENGRAESVFGERGGRLTGALDDMSADARDLAARVLDDEQLRTLEDLVGSWHEHNPRVEAVSFVRFAQFARGDDRPRAEELLGAGDVFFGGIGAAGEAVDEAARVAERGLYRAERAATLARWQVEAAKADALATPEIESALAQIGSLGDRMDALPGEIGSEVRSALTALDDRLPAINRTIDNARGVVGEAEAMADSFERAGEAVRGAVRASSALVESSGDGGGSMDAERIERAAGSIGDAAQRVDRAAESLGTLLGSAEGMDRRLDSAADAADRLIRTVFWRLVALMGVFFAMLLLYRAVVARLAAPQLRERGAGRAHRRRTAPADP